MRRVDRLAPTDLAVLWPEDFGWPQDVGLLAVLDDAGGLDVEKLRAHVQARAGALPARFHKVLARPRRGLGRPYWVDTAALDMQYHVRTVRLPPGAGEEDLLAACEAVRRRRFDPRRPLWHLTLLEGLADGQVGIFLDVHHCVVDGVSGVMAFGAFVDLASPGSLPQPQPRPAPRAWDLLLDVAVGALRGLRALGGAVVRPARIWSDLARDVHAVRRNAAGGRAPLTSLNAALGSSRRYALVRADLDRCKAAAHRHGATVNDVLLCVLAGGLRALLARRGEDPGGMLLRAAVPVALHTGSEAAEGNRDGGLLLALPVGEADPVARLRLIASDSADRKAHAMMSGAASLLFRAGFAQRLALRLAATQRMSSSYVANVPGPPMRLTLAGAPIREAFPIVPLLGNLTVGLGALSYAGQLGITVVADADACPDLEVLTAGMEADLASLVQSPHPATVG